VIAVPVAKFLGLGSIIGYLGAGHPDRARGALKLVTNAESMLGFAEFGVVLMLFLIGLELEPQRLWSLRKPIFGWGSVQLLGSALLLALGAMAFGIDWRLAGRRRARPGDVVDGDRPRRSRRAQPHGDDLGRERPQRRPAPGHRRDPDPGDAALPRRSPPGTTTPAAAGSAPPRRRHDRRDHPRRPAAAPARAALDRQERHPEIFTAASLLLVVATAALMHAVGLSMALGAFLAGVLLAESEYRRELETDIEPFKGLLLGLFFIAVGMNIDFQVVLDRPLQIAGVVVAFLGDQGGGAVGDGPGDADPEDRAAGLHHPARPGRRVRLRRLPDRDPGRRDRRRRCPRSSPRR
jgi:glutathione-regulated potassium-efflux system ancillary protein KefC